MSIAVFGDVHGHSKVLAALHAKTNAAYPHITQWYGCGDLVDRGPDSHGVIQFCIDNQILSALGNHDEWFLSYIRGDRHPNFLNAWLMPNNGGEKTLLSYGIRPQIVGTHSYSGRGWYVSPDQPKVDPLHEEWLASRPTVIETDHGYLLHGGIGPSMVKEAAHRMRDSHQSLTQQRLSMEEAVARVTPFHCSPTGVRWFYKGQYTAEKSVHYYPFDKPQIVGHNAVLKPVVSNHHIAIDTGCGLGPDGVLTALVLPEKEFVQVTMKEIYDVHSE